MHLSLVVNSGNKRRKLFHPGREGSFRCLCCWAQRRNREFLFIKSNHRGPACCKALGKERRLKNYNCKPCLPADIYIYIYVCIILRWFSCRKTCASPSKSNGIPHREQELLAKFLTAIGLLQLTLNLQIQIVLLVQIFTEQEIPIPTFFSSPFSSVIILFPEIHILFISLEPRILYFLFLSTNCGLRHSPCYCMHSSY